MRAAGEHEGGDRPGAEEVAATLGEVFPVLVRFALARQERRRREAAPERRLSPPQQLTLLVLRDGPVPVSGVAEGTGVAVSSATRMLQGLERQGLVERRVAPAGADRRLRHMGLTPAGRELLDRSLEVRRERFRELVAPLAPEDRAALLRGVLVAAEMLRLAEEGPAPGR